MASKMAFVLQKMKQAAPYVALFVVVRTAVQFVKSRPHDDIVPISGRKRKMFGGERTELQEDINQQINADYEATLEEYKKNDALYEKDNEIVVLCQKIVDKVVKANPELQGYNWEVNAASDYDQYASAHPNGRILVQSAMLVAANETELAAILCHEIGHVYARHFAEIYLRPSGFIANLFQPQEEEKDVHKLLHLEVEADHLGLVFMAKAGYDPQHALGVFQKMAHEEQMRDLGPEKWGTYIPFETTSVEHIKITSQRFVDRFDNFNKMLPNIRKEFEGGFTPDSLVNAEFWNKMEQFRKETCDEFRALDAKTKSKKEEENKTEGEMA